MIGLGSRSPRNAYWTIIVAHCSLEASEPGPQLQNDWVLNSTTEFRPCSADSARKVRRRDHRVIAPVYGVPPGPCGRSPSLGTVAALGVRPVSGSATLGPG